MAVGDTEKPGIWSIIKNIAKKTKENPGKTAATVVAAGSLFAVHNAYENSHKIPESLSKTPTPIAGENTRELSPEEKKVKDDYEKRQVGPNYHGAPDKTGYLADPAPTAAVKPPVGTK